MMEPITRNLTFRAVHNDDTGDGLTLEGIAAVFNEETVIDSWWEGKFREQISPNAFDRTLADDRDPVLQFDHGSHPMVGSMPLGRIDILEARTEGLFVSARMSDNWLVEPVRDAIRDDAITGMSIRFRVLGETTTPGDDEGQLDLRTITDVELLELGPVVFPAYASTSVGVRSDLADRIRDPEVLAAFAQVLFEQRGDADRTVASTTDPNNDKPVPKGSTKLRLLGL